MRIVRATAAALAASLLIGGSAVASVEDGEESLPTPVTGVATGSWGFGTDQGNADHQESYMEEVLVGQGYVEHQEIEWSDPRLPSSHWIGMDYAIYGTDETDGVMTVTTTHLLIDENGAWRGTGRAVQWNDRFLLVPAEKRYSTYELVGEGAYEGLYALLRGTPGPDAPGPWDLSYEGHIFEGALPAFPEPVEPLDGEGVQHHPFPTEPPMEG